MRLPHCTGHFEISLAKPESEFYTAIAYYISALEEHDHFPSGYAWHRVVSEALAVEQVMQLEQYKGLLLAAFKDYFKSPTLAFADEKTQLCFRQITQMLGPDGGSDGLTDPVGDLLDEWFHDGPGKCVWVTRMKFLVSGLGGLRRTADREGVILNECSEAVTGEDHTFWIHEERSNEAFASIKLIGSSSALYRLLGGIIGSGEGGVGFFEEMKPISNEEDIGAYLEFVEERTANKWRF